MDDFVKDFPAHCDIAVPYCGGKATTTTTQAQLQNAKRKHKTRGKEILALKCLLIPIECRNQPFTELYTCKKNK
jgi:hypothetical protein